MASSLALCLLPWWLAACTSDRPGRMLPEQFGSTTTHSRNYAAGGTAACEAARRALLSQGYVINLADADHVNGKKNFQPQPESHVEVEFHVVCAPEDRAGRKSIVFVNALQDRYALKKSNNSASLGVGVLGSVSLPFTSSDDAMVKVASETITTDLFYERFFGLVDRYLAADTLDDVPMPMPIPPPPALPMAAASGPGAASAAVAALPASSAASTSTAASAVTVSPPAGFGPASAPSGTAPAPASAPASPHAAGPTTAPASLPAAATASSPASLPAAAPASSPASSPQVVAPAAAASAPALP